MKYTILAKPPRKLLVHQGATFLRDTSPNFLRMNGIFHLLIETSQPDNDLYLSISEEFLLQPPNTTLAIKGACLPESELFANDPNSIIFNLI